MLRPRKVDGRWVLARTGAMAVVDYSAEKRGTPASPPEQDAPAAEPDDPIEQVKQLSELREQGILTEEEFTAEKKRLLGI
jgi:hypothetical protein